ncbi:uncharacterized protein LOC143150666 [Ptiloglossa arizonensis]|uniref:uncharacterized protein LOC143150666 n=1 Tax=Ptiloglossa arizonensis TaxID=3350558 RepID=UPI003FA03A85
MIKSRFEWWFETSGLPSSQAGFRAGKSCSDNLTALALTIEETLSMNKDVLVCFLNVKRTLDYVDRDTLLNKFCILVCSHKITNFVSCLTHEQNVVFALNPSSTVTRKAFKGLPQDGLLCHFLYPIYVKNIITKYCHLILTFGSSSLQTI